jgi:aspartyl-tRNA(Asn)/glutamyl-tRNA(Gln) amidotransferase subunit C
MALNEKDVEYVANLARLDLSPEEKALFTRQLAHILEYIHKLNELETDEVPPTSHVLSLNNVFREDVVSPSTPPGEMLTSAPEQESGHYKVPKIIEEGAG